MSLPHPFSAPDYAGLVFMAEYSMCSQSTNVWIADRQIIGTDVLLKQAKIEWVDSDPWEMPGPTLSVRDRDNYKGINQLQFLFDALWSLGLRPAKHDPSGEVIETKDQHLSDLRTLLFHKMGIKMNDGTGRTG